jgi:hypothetical protein
VATVFELSELWCAAALQRLQQARETIVEFDAQAERAVRVVGEIAGSKVDHTLLLEGLAWSDKLPPEVEFARQSNVRLTFIELDAMQRAAALAAVFGEPGQIEAGGEAADLLKDLDAVNRDIADIAGSRTVSIGLDLPSTLKQLRDAPEPVLAAPKETPALYIPSAKRGARWKTALWTLGILFVVAFFSKNILFWTLLIAALGFFAAGAFITSNFDEEQATRRGREVRKAADLKRQVEQLDTRARRILALMILKMQNRLSEFSDTAERCVAPLVNTARLPGDSITPELIQLRPSQVSTPLVSYLSSQLHASPDGGFLRDPLGDCDELEVVVDSGIDGGRVGRAMARAALGVIRPGSGRFMFIEPGRLAEAYRVFGALNDTPATRLGERLYVTHVSELDSAVSALRTFVGRTKEAMTRETGRRVTDGTTEIREIALQRAVVVLDRTEEGYWPEKDQRRLHEYYSEVQGLAQVGAREGSVLLISLWRSSHGRAASPGSSIRGARLVTAPEAGLPSINYMAADNASDVASVCDRWAQAAKKADSPLRQKGARLDWSDTEASDTRYGIEVEIGLHGAGRPARLVLGRDGGHHAICIGRTGSGKTNLFHVIVSNLVRRYSPMELELYLLDFKEGVEFAVYADLALPHCKAVAIDADRGFGLSVLAHLRRELNRRANVFKAAGVGITSLERYEESTGLNMPRIVLLIDEFQVLLQGEKMAGVATGASAAALEDLVRRGRSFGLHVILGSQTLAGRELTPATLGQLAVRVILPCSAPDAAMLLGDQAISSQLRAPGDAIVWSAGQGDVSDANLAKIFASNLDDLPELAETSRAHMIDAGTTPTAPFVFRGSGQNDLSEVIPHLRAQAAESRDKTAALFALGAPTAFGERPAGVFESRRGRNLLFVHRAEEARSSFFYSVLESVLTLNNACHVFVCDLEDARDFTGGSMSAAMEAIFGNRVQIIEPANLESSLAALAARKGGPRSLLAIAGAGRSNLCRTPVFAKLLGEGPEQGLHVLATCDSVRNLERFIERSSLSEFGMRALGAATGADSQRLLDSNDAETLTSEQQYLLHDDAAVGRLVRLQILTSSIERGYTREGELETDHA